MRVVALLPPCAMACETRELRRSRRRRNRDGALTRDEPLVAVLQGIRTVVITVTGACESGDTGFVEATSIGIVEAASINVVETALVVCRGGYEETDQLEMVFPPAMTQFMLVFDGHAVIYGIGLESVGRLLKDIVVDGAGAGRVDRSNEEKLQTVLL